MLNTNHYIKLRGKNYHKISGPSEESGMDWILVTGYSRETWSYLFIQTRYYQMLVRMAYLTSLEYNFKFSKTVNYEGFRLILTEVFISSLCTTPTLFLHIFFFSNNRIFQFLECNILNSIK